MKITRKKNYYAMTNLGYLAEISEKEYNYMINKLDQEHPDYIYEEYEVDGDPHAKIVVDGEAFLYWIELKHYEN